MNNIEENNNDTPKKSTELICFKIIFLISFISLSIALNTNLTYNLFKKTNKIVINYRDYDQAIQNNLTSLKKYMIKITEDINYTKKDLMNIPNVIY